MSPIVIDITCVLVVVVSLLIGYFRGFVRSLLSVLSWVIAAWFTWQYANLVKPYLDGFISDPTLLAIAAHLALFFTILLIVSILGAIAAKFIVNDNFQSADRSLGIAFGAVRGVVIVLLLALFGSLIFVPEQQWWQESIALTLLEPYVNHARETLSAFFEVEQVANQT